MIAINNPDDQQIKEFTLLREKTLHAHNLAIAESEKIYLKLIHNNIHIEKTLCLPDFAKKHHLSGNNVFICSREILNSIAGFKTEFDVIALFQRPASTSLEKLDNKIIAMNGLTSPENVGSIVRTATAFNVNSVLYDHKTCSPFLRRCIRVSMGNVFYTKTHSSSHFLEDLNFLQRIGYTIISTANVPGALDYSHFEYPDKAVLIIGSEGHGIDSEILKASDKILYIPINPHVAHLNAANAASIFLSKFHQ